MSKKQSVSRCLRTAHRVLGRRSGSLVAIAWLLLASGHLSCLPDQAVQAAQLAVLHQNGHGCALHMTS